MSEIGIVGGGLTGLMMAIALSHSSDSLTLVTKGPISPINNSDDNRTTTINAAGKLMLEVLGVWSKIKIIPTPINKILVAQGSSQSRLEERHRKDFVLGWHSPDCPIAYVVDNLALFEALFEILDSRTVKVLQPAKVNGMKIVNGKARLTGNCPSMPDFDLVIACDGTRSKLCESYKIRKFISTHRQTAIVGLLKLQHDHDNTAFQRFLADGPIALMPSGSKMASLVWTMSKANAEKIFVATDSEFDEACNAAFGSSLGVINIVGKRHSWQLQPTWMPKLGTDHLLFAGDAAHHLHPLAGQGYNLALADAAILADCISKAHHRGLTAGHPSVRQAYQRGRQVEIAAMTAMTNGLNMTMSYAPNKLAKIAGLGMSVINASSIKNLFQSIASGGVLARANLLEGRLPD